MVQVKAGAQIPSLAWELSHASCVAEKEKKERETIKHSNLERKLPNLSEEILRFAGHWTVSYNLGVGAGHRQGRGGPISKASGCQGHFCVRIVVFPSLSHHRRVSGNKYLQYMSVCLSI